MMAKLLIEIKCGESECDECASKFHNYCALFHERDGQWKWLGTSNHPNHFRCRPCLAAERAAQEAKGVKK